MGDTSGYYFPSQNRFVPSSGSFPRQQQSLNGFRGSNSNSGFSAAPGSYQEQLLFIANENSNSNNKQTQSAANSPYGTQFGGSPPFAKPNRQTDYYDISPRPFGVPVSGGVGGGVGGGATSQSASATSSNGFTRSKAIRNGSGSGSGGSNSLGNSLNGFQPQTQRVNVPHQQTQFLAHFNENDKRLTSSNAGLRPFGNGGGFSPSAHRTRTQAPPALAAEADAPPQSAATPYRLRNRFHPSTSAASSSTPTSTTTGSSAEVSSKRYNRFGSNRGAAKTTSTTSSNSASSTTQNTPAERPSFGRKPNPRRPVFISREINEPVSVVSKRPFNYNSARLKLPRPTSITTSTTEGVDLKESDEQYEQESQEQEPDHQQQQEHEQEQEQTHSGEHEESSSLEKLPLQEETITPIAVTKTELNNSQEHTSIPDASDDDQVVETTSNEDLDKSNTSSSTSSTEESQTDSSEVHEFNEETTLPNTGHEYEYVEEEEKATTAISKDKDSTEEEQTELDAITTTEQPAVEPVSTTTPSNTEAKPAVPETQKEDSVKQEDESEYDDEEGEGEEGGEEYEYEDEEEGEAAEGGEEESKAENNATAETEVETTHSNEKEHEDGREIISVVTTKSVVNGSTAYPSPVTPSSLGTTLTDSQPAPLLLKEREESDVADDVVNTTALPSEDDSASVPNVTESYVVVASIQTSRSINGARFLSFPAIEQEETKQTLSELERKVHSKQQQKQADLNESSEEPNTTTPTSTMDSSSSSSSTTERSLAAQGVSTESIIDKLDRVQSELSSGVLSGKYPIISQMDAASTPATTITTGGRFAPHIRKFQPRTTASPSTTRSGSKLKVQHFDEAEMDELAGLLPVGFKPKSSYKNRKITTTTTTTTTESPLNKKPGRNSTISRSFKNGVISVQDVGLAGLLPKGYKPPRTTTTKASTTKTSNVLDSLFSDVKFDDTLAALLPKDYNLNASTSKPAISIVDDISKFLPPGFSPSTPTATAKTTTTTQRSPAVAVPFDDLSKFLPPGYKAAKKQDVPKIIPLKVDDISSLLPPGFKLNGTIEKPKLTVATEDDELLASLLPPGYKSKSFLHPASTSTTTSKPKPSPSSTEAPAMETTTSGSGLKVVFPKGFHKRIGVHRLTTPHPSHDGDSHDSHSPQSGGEPPVVIKKGPPMRATTEFTGWPTPPTTPLSIEKLNAQTINFEDLLTAAGTSSSTTTTTTSTTTTTTTTPRPTKPGHCTADCDLEATIKIIDGVAWKPELLDHNTLEWKNLAHELEAQLNDVYSNAAQLKKWYKKVRIDSFSEGSVLVDYYVELANITEDVDTLEIKQLFHDALTKPATHMLPDKDAQENETDSGISGPQEEQLVKASYQMGKFIIDPVATEFSVIAKNIHTNVESPSDDLPIPQWAIVVIVIGVGSLVFVIIFGVTVLLNRQKRAKKTPIPLTNDMLNELKVNHMGGADNYGVDDFYNIDDPWNDTKQPIKPKRFTNSMHGSNSSNIYDSWRSTRHPHGSNADYFYDQQPTYSQKGDSLKRPQLHHQHQHQHHQQQQQQQQYPAHQQGYGHQYPDAFADAHQMYSYNNHASRTRYSRDYDPDF
ncbi:GH21810 [Drosophila grimshawi]|uniref:GH21810 n=1 Tax=Drosophila grimshawi TaxID=7222 RepID=B4J792_DROGR|nr:GH21810 [Drosophila grimshawi]